MRSIARAEEGTGRGPMHSQSMLIANVAAGSSPSIVAWQSAALAATDFSRHRDDALPENFDATRRLH